MRLPQTSSRSHEESNVGENKISMKAWVQDNINSSALGTFIFAFGLRLALYFLPFLLIESYSIQQFRVHDDVMLSPSSCFRPGR